MPIVFGHLLAIASEPGQILDLRVANIASLEKLAAAQDRVAMEQPNQRPGGL